MAGLSARRLLLDTRLRRAVSSSAGPVAPVDRVVGDALRTGDADRALHWIDAGIEERSPRVLSLGINAGYDLIRGDVRFTERLVRIGPAR